VAPCIIKPCTVVDRHYSAAAAAPACNWCRLWSQQYTNWAFDARLDLQDLWRCHNHRWF